MAAFFTWRVYHQPSCVPANAAMATISIMRVVFLIYAPGAASPPTKNHAKKITAVIKITTGKRIPILISSPVSVFVTP